MPMRLYLDYLVEEGFINRLEEHLAEKDSRSSLSGNFLANIAQRPAFSTPGPLFPPLDTHSMVYSSVHQRIAHPSEFAFAQGLDSLAHVSGGRRVSDVWNVISSLTISQQLKMLGNGIHIPTLSVWMLFVLAHIRPISQLAASIPRGLVDPEIDTAPVFEFEDPSVNGMTDTSEAVVFHRRRIRLPLPQLVQ